MEIFRMTEFYLRLKASVEANKFRYGYPWIYSNEIISDRRTKSLLPGSFCTLIDYNKNPICLVTVNPNSKIFARVMDYNLETIINAYWLKDKISKALAKRKEIFRDPFYRLVNAEADELPGLIVDRFDNVIVMQPNAFWAENMSEIIATDVAGSNGVIHVINSVVISQDTTTKFINPFLDDDSLISSFIKGTPSIT